MQDFPIPQGFVFGAVKAGLKASGNIDFAIAEAPQGAAAAAMFTRNRVVAAPVTLGKDHLKKTRGRVRAVVVNAGNANCATGKPGYVAAQKVCVAAGNALEAAPEFVLPSSTGIIGVPLPVEKLTGAVPSLLSTRGSDAEAVMKFARAIMTTDTRPKLAWAEFSVNGEPCRVLGIGKGAGMIHPDLATMLVYVFTDAEATPALLQSVLRDAVATSFNTITIDGDTSTNDTVALLASGASGVNVARGGARERFARAVHEVCASLAEQIVADGEGAKHVIHLTVEGAVNAPAADRIARTIAHSMLVKTAWAGADPNWGRLLAAAGRAGVMFDPAKTSIWIGPTQICRNGAAVDFDAKAVHEFMKQPTYDVRMKVGAGKGKARITTCDLTTDYVHINADYST